MSEKVALTEPPADQVIDPAIFADRAIGVGTWFLREMWYFALPSEQLKRGAMISKIMLDEPILLGRDSDGKAFAMRNICPHQGIPLTDGSFDGRRIECSFHGWKFGTDGVCTEIPSLATGQRMNICHVRSDSYMIREVQGNIWVYFGNKQEDLPPVPTAPGLDGMKWWKTTTTMILPHHIDYAVAALIDTAHVPFVHKSWWWRSKRQLTEKAKLYVPSELGWTMVKHSPSKQSIIFKMIADFIETEISFCLPGCRRESVSYRNRTMLSAITALTPVDSTHTQLTNTTYWTIPVVAPVMRLIVNYFVEVFLGQDRDIAIRQQVGLKYKPPLIMLIADAGTPGAWYFQLKTEWAHSVDEGRKFVNPVTEKVLRWRT